MTDLADFDQIDFLNFFLNNVCTHTSLTVLSIIMSGWVGASKNNLASLITQSTKKLKSSNF